MSHSRLVGLLALLSVTPASAGILVVETRESAKVSEGLKTTRVHIDKDRVAIEVREKQGHHAFIFRGDRQAMWMVDYDEKVYREVTAETVEQMRHQWAQAKAAMEAKVAEQLQAMPPEQRQATEQAMKARVAAAANGPLTSASPAVVFTKADSTGKTGRWECEWYVGRAGGVKAWDVCAIDWSKLDFKREDFEIIGQIPDFFRSLNPQSVEDLLQVGPKQWKKSRSYPGFPLQRISYNQGMLSAVYQVIDIRRQEFEDSIFEVPADFQKRALVMANAPSP